MLASLAERALLSGDGFLWRIASPTEAANQAVRTLHGWTSERFKIPVRLVSHVLPILRIRRFSSYRRLWKHSNIKFSRFFVAAWHLCLILDSISADIPAILDVALRCIPLEVVGSKKSVL